MTTTLSKLVMQRQDLLASGGHGGLHDMDDDDAYLPNYDVATSPSNTTTSSPHYITSRSLYIDSPPPTPPLNVTRRLPKPPLPGYVYTYFLMAGNTPISFLISVEQSSGKSPPGSYTFRLSFKISSVQRDIGEPVYMNLSVDPSQLEFVTFAFPGKSSLPANCLWSLRVWLRVNGFDHRLFGEDEVWIGRDPNFNAVEDASFSRFRRGDPNIQVYHGNVGKAVIVFIVRWTLISDNLYSYSMEYEAGGVGSTLFEDMEFRIDEDPRNVTFLIYTVPTSSIPPGAAHRLRVWLRVHLPPQQQDPTSSSYSLSQAFTDDSYVYHRIWKTDSFKVGQNLDFSALGSKMALGRLVDGGPEIIGGEGAVPPVPIVPQRAMNRNGSASTGKGSVEL